MKTLYIDVDNVLVNFETGIDRISFESYGSITMRATPVD